MNFTESFVDADKLASIQNLEDENIQRIQAYRDTYVTDIKPVKESKIGDISRSNTPILDDRNAKDIFDQMINLAKQYTPEWMIDETDPDFGVVLMRVLADMFSDTVNNYNKMPYKHYISFLNILGAKLLPPIPATGIVKSDVVPGNDGVYIPMGTSMGIPAKTQSGSLDFQTKSSMFAIYEKINRVLLTDKKYDIITQVYNNDDPSVLFSDDVKFTLFDATESSNIQKHEVYFEADNLFFSTDMSKYKFFFQNSHSATLNKKLPQVFSDKDNVKWQYLKESQWKDINSVKCTENGVEVDFEDVLNEEVCSDICNDNENETKNFELVTENGEMKKRRYIRCVFNNLPNEKIYLTDVNCKPIKEWAKIDTFSTNTAELPQKDFFPFSEDFSSGDCFYIYSKEAFNKKGAQISITVDVDFAKFPREQVQNLQDNIKYKSIMTELDFKKPEPGDITIESVCWEYYNGQNWVRIYKELSDNDKFFVPGEEKKRVLSFVCPDMQETNFILEDALAIRCRITKVKNALLYQGAFVTPIIKNVSVNYHYDVPQPLMGFYVKSDTQKKLLNFNEKDIYLLFKDDLNEHPTLYIGLENPMTRGPIQVFFDLKEAFCRDNPVLMWQCFTRNDQGIEQWQDLEIIDGTNNFEESGIISFMGNTDFAKTTICGKESYYLRIVNMDDRYDVMKNVHRHPVIKGIYFNAVEVCQTQVQEPEYFNIQEGEKNKICSLLHQGIVDVKVYVNERMSLTEEEREYFLNDDNTLIGVNAFGNLSELWVKWEKVDNIDSAKPTDRVFEVDSNKGEIMFGDGVSGRIPSANDFRNIRIEYSTCDGAKGNIQAGSLMSMQNDSAYIQSTQNLKQMVGGVDRETVDMCIERVGDQLSSMGRIVSIDDLESAIKYNNRSVHKVKCLAHVDRFNRKAPGVISIAILPKVYRQGSEEFAATKLRIENFIRDKAPVNFLNGLKIDVFETNYVNFQISADIVIKDYNSYQQVYQDVQRKLKVFLNPIRGNFDGNGWNIGMLPRKEIVYNCIKMINNIVMIRSLNIFNSMVTVDGVRNIDESVLKNESFVVPDYVQPKINLFIK